MDGQIVIDPKNPDKGKKYDEGKPLLGLISSIATVEKGRVLTAGGVKYGWNNWREGLSWMRVISAVLRHIFAWIGGEDKDPETGISHLAHAACGIDFLLEYEVTHREKDDRWKK